MLIPVAAALAWSNSLSSPFHLDDRSSIHENASIRHLWPPDWLNPPTNGETVGGRPVLNLTFALNYAAAGTDVRSYRTVNVTIHALAALTLFGVVRRLMLARGHGGMGLLQSATDDERREVARSATITALAVALLWAVHPLQTGAVTYVVQRAESLCGLMYLSTLYAFLRGTEKGTAANATNDIKAQRRGMNRWLWLSLASCLVGMGTKEVMCTAPVVVLLCDRAFVGGSFAEAWRLRRAYYLGLGATWLLLAALVLHDMHRGGSAGFGVGVEGWRYFLTQCEAIGIYLRKSIWPNELVFDYGTPLVAGVEAVKWQLGLILVLLAATAWALRRHPRIGTVGAAFFLILAPTSSFVPVATQTIAEHRMYLPLAALLGLLALAVCKGCERLPGRRAILGTLAAITVVTLGAATFARNAVYRTDLALWSDTASKRPDNPRARYNRGLALANAGRDAEAAEEFRQALALQPTHAFAHFELGKAALVAGRWNDAAQSFGAALTADPGFRNARVNLARALVRDDKAEEALRHYRDAWRDEPEAADVRGELVTLLVKQGRKASDEGLLREAVRLDERNAAAWFALGNLNARGRRFGEAIPAYQAVLALDPTHVEARGNLANSLLFAGRVEEAIAQYEKLVALRPDDARVRENLRLAREALYRR